MPIIQIEVIHSDEGLKPQIKLSATIGVDTATGTMSAADKAMIAALTTLLKQIKASIGPIT